MPYNTWTQPRGHTIFRSCKNDDIEPFESISRIAYNPNPDYIERANLKEKSIGYGSQDLKTAAIENCQWYCRNTIQRTYYLTIGEWMINRDLNSIIICHSKKALNAGTDLKFAYQALLKRELNKNNRKEFRIWNLKNRFFAEQFAKKKINHENDYLYSALYSNTVFKSKEANIDCIVYPSVVRRYTEFNYAYKPVLIDDKSLTLIRAFHVKIEFRFGTFRTPKRITILKTTTNFGENSINWDI
jgi:hypothetical protein